MQTLILHLFSAQYALAQSGTEYTPLVSDLPAELSTTDAVAFLIGLFTVLIMVVTLLAVVWIVLGGIQYMSTDAYSGKSAGKEKIKNALIGLLLAGASWIILYTINPQILNINFTYGGSINYSENTTPPSLVASTPIGDSGPYIDGASIPEGTKNYCFEAQNLSKGTLELSCSKGSTNEESYKNCVKQYYSALKDPNLMPTNGCALIVSP